MSQFVQEYKCNSKEIWKKNVLKKVKYNTWKYVFYNICNHI